MTRDTVPCLQTKAGTLLIPGQFGLFDGVPLNVGNMNAIEHSCNVIKNHSSTL